MFFIEGWDDLPIGSKRLIIYYTVSSIPYVANILFPLYLFVLGWEIILVGLLYSLAYLSSIIGSIIVGHLFDRGFQPKIAMFIIDFVAFISMIIYCLADSVWAIYLTTLVSNFVDPLTTAYQTMEKELYPEDKMELVFSFHMALPNISQILGFVFFGALLYFNPGLSGFRLVFLIAALLYLLSAVYILIYLPSSKPVQFSFEVIFRIPRDFYAYFVAELLIIFAYSIVPQFLLFNYIYNVWGFSATAVIIMTIPANISGYVGSVIAEKTKNTRLGLLISTVGLALIHIAYYFTVYATEALIIFVATLLFTFISYLFHTIWFVYHRSQIYRRIPDSAKGTIFGTISSARLVVFTATPFIASYITQKTNPLTCFLIAGLVFLLDTAIYAVITKGNRSADNLQE